MIVEHNPFGFNVRLGYHSAEVSAREGYAQAGSGQAHAKWDRPRLLNQSREFYRDNSIYSGMINRSVNYIIGPGFKLQVHSSDKAANEQIEGLWKSFWASPDIRKVMTGKQLEEMVCRELLLCGDTGVLLTEFGLIQHIEAEQITSSSNPDGIDTDEFGRPTRFWVSPYKNGYVSQGEANEVDPDDILFVASLERPSSLRGVPMAQSAFPMLLRINDVCDAEAIAWQVLCRHALVETSEGAGEEALLEAGDDPAPLSATRGLKVTDLDYAMIYHAEPGSELKGVERNIPGDNFTESLHMFLRLMGLPLGLPLEIILLDWTKSNYSQSRAVLEQTFQTFRKWQRLLVDFFYTPLLEWKVQEWIESGLIDVLPEDFSFEWILPTFPWIDPRQEAEANSMAVELGFESHGTICKERGHERSELLALRKQEITEAIEIAKSLKATTGMDVPWQYFAGIKPQKDGSEKQVAEEVPGKETK